MEEIVASYKEKVTELKEAQLKLGKALEEEFSVAVTFGESLMIVQSVRFKFVSWYATEVHRIEAKQCSKSFDTEEEMVAEFRASKEDKENLEKVRNYLIKELGMKERY